MVTVEEGGYCSFIIKYIYVKVVLACAYFIFVFLYKFLSKEAKQVGRDECHRRDAIFFFYEATGG